MSHAPSASCAPRGTRAFPLARLLLVTLVVASLLESVGRAQELPPGFDDHRDMMEQLGIKALRPGADPKKQETFDEATANPYKDTMPDVLAMKDGTRVTRPEQWPARRAEIVEDFEREVYGRIPPNVPRVTWEVASTTTGTSGGVRTVTRNLLGRVDNAAYPKLSVTIEASFTVPADAATPVPMMISLDRGFLRRRPMTATATRSLYST